MLQELTVTSNDLDKDVNWLSALSAKLRQSLLNLSTSHILKRDEHFKLQRLTESGANYVKCGTVVVTMQSPNTKAVNNMVFGTGDWFGNPLPAKYSYLPFQTAIWKEIEVLHFDNQKIALLADKDVEVYKWLYYMSTDASPKWLQAQLLGAESKEIRVVHMLFELALHNDEGASRLYLPISQQLLSDMVGISRQRVNEVLVALQSSGCLELGRNSIKLNDIGQLASMLNSADLNFRDPRKKLIGLI